jgi:hypothetical protein
MAGKALNDHDQQIRANLEVLDAPGGAGAALQGGGGGVGRQLYPLLGALVLGAVGKG